MDIRVISGTAAEVAAALSNLDQVSFATAHCNAQMDVAQLQAALPNGALHGATSCLGAMTHTGTTEDAAVFALIDPQGAYGTAMRPFNGIPFAAAQEATLAALEKADRVGEQPELVWVSATPGSEEEVLAGIEAAIDADVPIIGGSAADNDVSGGWYVFDGTTKEVEGVVVSVLFPSGPVSFAYQNGYAPTKHAGAVTKCQGRTLQEIDHRPALDVYLEWTRGAVPVDRSVTETQSILAESTLTPLGREVAEVGGVPYYLLAHPAAAQASGEVELFANVEVGETLTCMSGTIDSLTKRAGRVASLAVAAGSMAPSDVKGALMIYCGGCMLTVRDQIAEVVAGVNTTLGQKPFLGAYTFGEQGRIVGAGNRHGNLMISCIIFG